MSDVDDREPQEPDRPHWALDLPDGATVEDLADSLIREASAVCAMSEASVFIRRGNDGPWFEVTAEMRRKLRRR